MKNQNKHSKLAQKLLTAVLPVCLLAGSLPVSTLAAEPSAAVWAEDSLTKIFRASIPTEDSATIIAFDAARNGYYAGQLAIRADHELTDITVEVSALTGPDNARIEPAQIKATFEDYVTLTENTSDLSLTDRLDAPDGALVYPDRITKDSFLASLPANTTQAVWYSVYFEKELPPGVYTGSVDVKAGSSLLSSLPVSITVYDVTLPDGADSEYMIYHWLGDFWDTASPETQYGVEMWSEDWWKIIESYAQYMKKIRNNVLFLDVFKLTLPVSSIHPDGSVTYNFERFDRFVKIFEDVGAINKLHASSFLGWTDTFVVPSGVTLQDGKPVIEYVHIEDLENGEPTDFMTDYFTQLEAHLKEIGWMDRFVHGGGSEPQSDTDYHVVNWFYDTMKEYFPQFHIDDPNHVFKPTPNIGSYIIKQDNYDRNIQHWRALQDQGKDICLYVCSPPADKYMNRLTQMELAKAMLIHWYTFQNDMTGYLHWGFNVWYDQDVLHTGDPRWTGDAYIVYPDRENLGLFSSIRSEAMLEGAQDHELMRLLEAAGQKDRALEIAGSVVTNGSTYTTDHDAIYSARRALLESLAPQRGIIEMTDDLTSSQNMFACGSRLTVADGQAAPVPFSEHTLTDHLNGFEQTAYHTPNLMVTDCTHTQGCVSRTSDTVQSLVYQQDNMTAFSVKAFFTQENALELSASPDGVAFTEILVSASEGASPGEWVLTGTLPSGSHFLKLDLLPNGSDPADTHICEVAITYADTSDYLAEDYSLTYSAHDLKDIFAVLEYEHTIGLRLSLSSDGRSFKEITPRFSLAQTLSDGKRSVQLTADDIPAGSHYFKLTFTADNIGSNSPALSELTYLCGNASYSPTRPLWKNTDSLKISDVAKDSALISWNVPSGNVTGYSVYCDGEKKETLSAEETSLQLTSLASDCTFSVAVVAHGEADSAALCSTFRTLPESHNGLMSPDMLSVEGEWTAGSRLSMELTLSNLSSGSQQAFVTAMLVTAEGKMLAQTSADLSLSRRETTAVPMQLTIPENLSSRELHLELLVWDSDKTMIPLTPVITYVNPL